MRRPAEQLQGAPHHIDSQQLQRNMGPADLEQYSSTAQRAALALAKQQSRTCTAERQQQEHSNSTPTGASGATAAGIAIAEGAIADSIYEVNIQQHVHMGNRCFDKHLQHAVAIAHALLAL